MAARRRDRDARHREWLRAALRIALDNAAALQTSPIHVERVRELKNFVLGWVLGTADFDADERLRIDRQLGGIDAASTHARGTREREWMREQLRSAIAKATQLQGFSKGGRAHYALGELVDVVAGFDSAEAEQLMDSLDTGDYD